MTEAYLTLCRSINALAISELEKIALCAQVRELWVAAKRIEVMDRGEYSQGVNTGHIGPTA